VTRPRLAPLVLACAAALVATLLQAGPAHAGTGAPRLWFEAGAAAVDITPPPWTPASDQTFVPACGASPAEVEQLWPGTREFAFEEPYVDLYHLGRYAPGDPYCDADHRGYYQAPFLAGGSSADRWPESVQPGDPLQAEAVVLALRDGVSGPFRKVVGLVVVDSIGLFDTTIDRIREDAAALAARRGLPRLSGTDLFVSSTHDESAPDPIGLWGADLSGTPAGATPLGPEPTGTSVTPGVDVYYLQFLERRTAQAVVEAEAALVPAALRLALAPLPSNVLECWSSYPFIADQLTPVMQAVALHPGSGRPTGKVLFTLVNGNTHVETLAFSGNPALTSMISGDWAGELRADLHAAYGGVGVELSGLVGSVETPTVYEPPSAQVVDVPGPYRPVPGNPDGCSSVYAPPSGATPVTGAIALTKAYAAAMAQSAKAALGASGSLVRPRTLLGMRRRVCLQLENDLFAAAFAAGLFPEREAYLDPSCTVGISTEGRLAGPARGSRSAKVRPATPLFLRTSVGLVRVGPAEIAYLPGEVFPLTVIRGAFDPSSAPFPTTCYDPATGSFACGRPMPMTPFLAAGMTAPYRFFAGLGEDMLGYLMPPGDFVGVPGETTEPPWSTYEVTSPNGRNGEDRFGEPHADDPESVGPHAGLVVADALARLLPSAGGSPLRVLPGLFLDAQGRLSDSPFPGTSLGGRPFGGAVGIEVLPPGAAHPVAYCVDQRAPSCSAMHAKAASAWATFDGTPDPGTAGTPYPYSVSTAGVLTPAGPLLVDVYAGAERLP
jgi:hypothetical protein